MGMQTSGGCSMMVAYFFMAVLFLSGADETDLWLF